MPFEVGAFAEEVRRVFLELGRTFGIGSLAGECAPPIDVFETDDVIEVIVDLPGVQLEAIRVMAKGNSLLVVGDKRSRPSRSESTFHLVERGYGRFARTVQLGGSCDTARVRATLIDGELRISVPKMAERRGRTIQIQLRAGEAGRAGKAGGAGK